MVENVAGAGGVIGVAKASGGRADGYTLVLGADSPIAIARLVYAGVGEVRPAQDLAPIALVTTRADGDRRAAGADSLSLAGLLELARASPASSATARPGSARCCSWRWR